MKKVIFILAALSSVTGAVQAQSSVTLYGIIDTGLIYNNNIGGKKLYAISSSNVQGTRWGLRGIEDLGGGLKALFLLENGFNPDTGNLNQGGDEFGRQAFVGIRSDRLGTITLGRQYDSVVDYTGHLRRLARR